MKFKTIFLFIFISAVPMAIGYLILSQTNFCDTGVAACLTELEPNEFGDLLAGLFATTAFFALIYTITLQTTELGLQRDELKLTRDELEGSRIALEAQAKAMSTQANTMEIQADVLKEQMQYSRQQENDKKIRVLLKGLIENLSYDPSYNTVGSISKNGKSLNTDIRTNIQRFSGDIIASYRFLHGFVNRPTQNDDYNVEKPEPWNAIIEALSTIQKSAQNLSESELAIYEQLHIEEIYSSLKILLQKT